MTIDASEPLRNYARLRQNYVYTSGKGVWEMTLHNEKYVVDENGERVAVVLGIQEFERMLAELEELEAIRSYDTAKAAQDEAIPFEQAVREIEQERR